MKRSRARHLIEDMCSSIWKEERSSLLDESSCICDIVSLFPENGEGKTVLDIGIGKGYRSIPLSYMNYRVYGIESSWQTIYSCKESYYRPYGIRVKECDVSCEEFPFPDGRFDWVVMSGLCWEQESSPVHTLSEIKRTTKPGARFIVHLRNTARQPTEKHASADWHTSGPLQNIELGGKFNADAEAGFARGSFDDIAEGYGFRSMLKLYRNAKVEPGLTAYNRLHRILSLVVPHFRDTVISVFERR